MELVPPPDPPDPPKPADIRRARVARRRLEVARLTLRGHSTAQIAAELEERPATIAADKRANLKAWHKETTDLEDAHRTRIVQQSRLVQAEAWAAWERSKDARKRTKQKAAPIPPTGNAQRDDAAGAGQMRPFLVEQVRQETPGDARFLAVVAKAQATEAKLLGLLQDPKPVEPPASIVDNSVRVLVIDDAGLDSDVPWLHNIPPGRAEHGKPLELPAVAGESGNRTE